MTNSVRSEGSDPQKAPTHPESSWEAIWKWFKKNRSQVIFFLGGLVLYLLLGLFLWWLLRLYVDLSAIKDSSKEATAKKDLIQALAFIMAGVAGAIGIYFTWRGQRLTQESTREELRIAREGQITDRFTRAIEHLGKVEGETKLFEIRVGGIYALERIARESEEDYWPIMEILSAYVRQNAPRPSKEGYGRQEVGPKLTLLIETTTDHLSTPDPDIQAIMAVIRRRRTRYHEHEDPEPLHLHETNLTRANLTRANLSGAFLLRASLYRASLYRASLSGASLSGASLHTAYLKGADLSGADLSGADLSGADLSGADLSGAEGLTQEQLEDTTGDENTQLPPDLTPPETWNVKTDEQIEGD